MYYYHDGYVIEKGKARISILPSDVELPGREAMTEEEALALLEKYEKEDRVEELKRLLAETDYIAAKIAEGAATITEYAEMIAQRQAWREEINRLQA